MLTYICHDCGHIFDSDEVKHMRSGEGYFDGEMEYTEWTCCPNCEGDYSEAIACEICGEYKAYDQDDPGNKWCERCKDEVSEAFDNFKNSLTREQLECFKAIWEDYDLL